MHKYRLIAKKGEGTFSEVLKAQSIKNGKYLAIKCMKNHFDSIEQVNNLREIQALRRLSPNPHIIKLYEVLYDQPTGRLALVFELMHCNIYELIRGRRHYLPESRVKMYTYQLVKAMDHMHRNGIFHRDIKPENILIMDNLLKLADFGSCRGIYSKQPYTEYISTRWYRAPECLLTDGYYGYKMDMWGVGCVLFEILALYPLFPGEDEMDQINKIHSIMGTPPQEVLAKFKRYSSHIDFNFPPKQGKGIAKQLPHVSPEGVDIIVKLLAYDPEDRISARQALRHPWFQEIRAADKRSNADKRQNAALRSTQPSASTSRTARSTASHSTAAATGGSSSKAAPAEGKAASTGANEGKANTTARKSSTTSRDAGAAGGSTTKRANADAGEGSGGSGSGEAPTAKGASTISSDPGLPTISGNKGATQTKTKRAGNQASSTIALPVSSTTGGGSSSTKAHGHHGHGHHGHHGHRGHRGHSHSTAATNASTVSNHATSRVPNVADASLPPIGKPLYSSTLRVGGVQKYHHNKHKHGRTKARDSKSKTNKYSYPRHGGKFHASSSSSTHTSRSMAGSVVSGKSAATARSSNKYLSPYSQKVIQKQRHG